MDWFLDTMGLCGLSGHRDAAAQVARGLDAMPHRGLARRIAAADMAGVRVAESAGGLRGELAIGEVHGQVTAVGLGSEGDNEQIVCARLRDRWVAVAFAGRLTNGAAARRELLDNGALLHTRSDAEVLLHLLATSTQRRFVNRLVDALWRLEGAYALLVLTEDHLIAVRDPSGFRPLLFGRAGDATMVATEDGAILSMGGEVQREMRPGEMLVLDGRAVQSVTPFPGRLPSACAQEYISLARADASPFGTPVHAARSALGTRLANEQPSPAADAVCSLPGAEAAAIAYGRRSNLPYLPVLLAEELPASDLPEVGRAPRWRAIEAAVRDRTLVLVSPAVTTGRALSEAVTELMRVGATAVHLRIASPPVVASCPYGVACPTPEELWVNRSEAVRDAAHRALGAASIGALDLASMRNILGTGDPQFHGLCDACMSGERPLEPDRPDDQLPLF